MKTKNLTNPESGTIDGIMRELTLLMAMFAAQSAIAQTAPLPPKIITARTVYIVNKTNQADVSDALYRLLGKWGYFQIVENQKDADLVFEMTMQTHQEIASGTTAVTNQITPQTRITSGSGPYSYTTGEVMMNIRDAKTDQSLWVNTKPFSKKGATHDLLADLKKRIERQTKK